MRFHVQIRCEECLHFRLSEKTSCNDDPAVQAASHLHLKELHVSCMKVHYSSIHVGNGPD